MSKLLCIVGPTASGKTALSIALAHLTGGEIVSADSMQIYRRMDIGTAKPSVSEREGVPHHMLDIIEPGKCYSAADYCIDASACIDDILARGKLPIIAGGTGLYIDTLTGHMSFDSDDVCDCSIRAHLWKLYDEIGNDELHSYLAKIDPESACAIHKNNVKRVIRAIEIYEASGHTMSERIHEAKIRPPKYDALTIGLTSSDREILYKRIDKRVDEMMTRGLEIEARTLYNENLGSTASQAIGYKELFRYFDDEMSLSEAISTIKRETRKYAKRQLTWFGRNKDTKWLSLDEIVNFNLIIKNSTEYLKSYGIMN